MATPSNVVPTNDPRWAKAQPRPDGYNGSSVHANPITYSVHGGNGYMGDSPLAARADHVHPLSYSEAKPVAIGIPTWFGGSQTKVSESTSFETFNSFGNIGAIAPSDATMVNFLKQTNQYCNTYALSNHTHPYGFCSNTSIASSDKPFNTFPDGTDCSFFAFTLQQSVLVNSTIINASVVPVVDTSRYPITSKNNSDKYGSMGTAPYPARLDHTHPLNLVENVVSGAVASSYISACGSSSSFGTSKFYCRLDHTHAIPLKSGGGIAFGSSGLEISNLTHDMITDWEDSVSSSVQTAVQEEFENLELSVSDITDWDTATEDFVKTNEFEELSTSLEELVDIVTQISDTYVTVDEISDFVTFSDLDDSFLTVEDIPPDFITAISSGVTSTIDLVTSVTWNGTTLRYQKVNVTLSKGLVTNIGTATYTTIDTPTVISWR